MTRGQRRWLASASATEEFASTSIPRETFLALLGSGIIEPVNPVRPRAPAPWMMRLSRRGKQFKEEQERDPKTALL